MAESGRRVAFRTEALKLYEPNTIVWCNKQMIYRLKSICSSVKLDCTHPVRVAAPTTGPVARRGLEDDRRRHKGSQYIEASESEDELDRIRNLEISYSKEEMTTQRKRRQREYFVRERTIRSRLVERAYLIENDLISTHGNGSSYVAGGHLEMVLGVRALRRYNSANVPNSDITAL
ncbi:hypothetical protein M5K25_000643 [Dendrobium thyrsiflorum]|uniref:Uncharacterized protein n=1 Tax=Dendrobium thyrsiflorum TaxID=117978 RepID=A0ABD0VUZ7_DENTH